MKRIRTWSGMVALLMASSVAAQQDLTDALKTLDARVYAPKSDEAKELQAQLGKWLRAQRDQVNRRDIQAWEAIRTKEDWESYRDAKIAALKKSLGTFPMLAKELAVHVAKTIPGDGFVIENLVYESRPDLWVTANLYRPGPPLTPNPSPQGGEGGRHPGVLIIHSHHNPKTQGELQDMGMTWARAGCYVLVPDQLGHGERRQHPFKDAKSYPGEFKVSRQDYHFRYNVAMHLHLVGESLVGWMANDLMRGVDLLYTKPGIDKKAIILLGSVAGGGDPAGVTAAIDPRITCVAPFNFGGPQPETKFPLPADAKQSFNYMGGGSWESTRGLRLSGRDGFLPWVIVGSVAPRALIHAHEFEWDAERDPVWTRYQQIFKFYNALDKLSFTKGAGSVSKSGPGNTHCNNIGVVHREAIHPMFAKWFGIKATEYSKRVPSEELQCLTPELKAKIKFTPVHELARRLADEDLQELRKKLRGRPADKQREEIVKQWRSLLEAPRFETQVDAKLRNDKLPGVKTYASIYHLGHQLETPRDQALYVPTLVLEPKDRDDAAPVVVAIAREGIEGFMRHRHEHLARLLSQGVKVVIPDLPGCGQGAAGESRGRTSANTSYSATAQMLGTTLTRLQLIALRMAIHYDARPDQRHPVILWGDSFAPVNSADTRLEVPYDVDKMPRLADPVGPTLALLAATLSDAPIHAVYMRGGLVSFRSLLDSPFIWTPHDTVIPSSSLAGDLDDLAAAFLSRKGTRLAIESPVDGVNRAVGQSAVESAYALAAKAGGNDAARLRLSAEASSPADVAAWLRGASSR